MKTKPFALARLALIAAAGLGATSSHAAFDAFLRFTGPQGGAVECSGESTDKTFSGHDRWIPLQSFGAGIFNQITFDGASPGAGKAILRELPVRKLVDSASPALFKANANGGHYDSADLALRQIGATGPLAPFYFLTMKTVFISSVQWSGAGGDDAVREDVTAAAGAFQWSYTRFNSSGVPTTTVTVNWDQINNTGGDGALTGSQNTAPTFTYSATTQTIKSGGSFDFKPTSGPSDPDGIAEVAIVSTGGYTGGITVGLDGILHLSNAGPVGGPYTITVRATDLRGLSKDATLNLTVNQNPPPLVANPDTIDRVLGANLTIPTANLIANDSSGATFNGVTAATTALGGHLTISGTDILYLPPSPDPGGDDTFTYTVTDTFNQTQNALVTLHVVNPNGAAGNLAITVTDTTVTLTLTATVGRSYQLQRASTLSGPWTNLSAPVTANPSGAATWTDPDTSSPRFYRTIQNP